MAADTNYLLTDNADVPAIAGNSVQPLIGAAAATMDRSTWGSICDILRAVEKR